MTKAQQIIYNAALKTEGALLDEIKRKVAANEAALNARSAALGSNYRSEK